ncbi:hypothetical protein [Actinomadura rudentiformis]|uniref:Uncharacterized protein n=1 Tax=Actinomadura rudentiformis TaxID=359158 RepID=A0A6H9YWU3_9ACTN|nr:hypothetical protein [Actinomadura rudentiformis]KAB2348461.1 hypothetical protein F8566_16895 [Actinomadura rudentiformis]
MGQRTAGGACPILRILPRWLRRPHKPKTIWNLHGLLYSIFQDAIEADPPLRSAKSRRSWRLVAALQLLQPALAAFPAGATERGLGRSCPW